MLTGLVAGLKAILNQVYLGPCRRVAIFSSDAVRLWERINMTALRGKTMNAPIRTKRGSCLNVLTEPSLSFGQTQTNEARLWSAPGEAWPFQIRSCHLVDINVRANHMRGPALYLDAAFSQILTKVI